MCPKFQKAQSSNLLLRQLFKLHQIQFNSQWCNDGKISWWNNCQANGVESIVMIVLKHRMATFINLILWMNPNDFYCGFFLDPVFFKAPMLYKRQILNFKALYFLLLYQNDNSDLWPIVVCFCEWPLCPIQDVSKVGGFAKQVLIACISYN